MNQERKFVIIIFFVAVFVRSILFVAVGSWQDEVLNDKILVRDAWGYHNLSVNLLQNHGFSILKNSTYYPNIRRTPLYPLLLSSLYFIFGYKPYIVILFQIVLSSITCVLTYNIGKLFLGKKFALFAGLLAACEYSSICICNMLLPDTLFTLLFILHIYFLLIFLTEDNNKVLIISTILLGLATLCKPVTVYFFVVLSIPLLFCSGKNFQKSILKYFTLILLFGLTITPWMVRNYFVAGEFLLSSQQREVLRWNVPDIYEKIQSRSEDASRIKNEKKKTEPPKKELINSVLSDTRKYLIGSMWFFIETGSSLISRPLGPQRYPDKKYKLREMSPNKIFKFIRKKSPAEQFVVCFYGLFLIFLYSTMCAGIYEGIKNSLLTIVLFISIIVYFVIANAPLPSSTRYRMPIMPYIILISSYGAMHIQNKINNYKLSRKRIEYKKP